jgi:ribosome biogenesis GTPase
MPKYSNPFERDRIKASRRKAKKNNQASVENKKGRQTNNYSNPDLWDDFDFEEPIKPIGSSEQKKQNEREAKKIFTETNVFESNLENGLVIEVSSGQCRISANGETLACTIRRALLKTDTGYTNLIAVGDQVKFTRISSHSGVIESVLPRKSMLVRPDVNNHRLKQVLVSNVDQILIIMSWRQPHIWPELIDRYLITAELNHIKPVICINKIDLVDDQIEFEKAIQAYRDLGYELILTSAAEKKGLQEIEQRLAKRITVLAGLSGVGKSSLLKTIFPHLEIKTGNVSEHFKQGRHTTTQSMLIQLDDGGMVIDTPGIREFGLADLHQPDLIRYYPEIGAHGGNCRFNNCSHTNEPDCAVIQAVEQGAIAELRFRNYQKIYETLPA